MLNTLATTTATTSVPPRPSRRALTEYAERKLEEARNPGKGYSAEKLRDLESEYRFVLGHFEHGRVTRAALQKLANDQLDDNVSSHGVERSRKGFMSGRDKERFGTVSSVYYGVLSEFGLERVRGSW